MKLESYTTVYMYYARYTRIIHYRPCCN